MILFSFYLTTPKYLIHIQKKLRDKNNEYNMPYSVLDLKLRITGNKYNYVHRNIQPDTYYMSELLLAGVLRVL